MRHANPLHRRRVTALGIALAAAGCGQAYFGGEGTVAGPVAPGDSVVVLAAGDIASCETPGDEHTAAILDTIPGAVLALGDNAYVDGSGAEYRACYTPTWGRHLERTRAAPGNHDYHTRGAAAFFAYFGERAGPPGRGYFSFELGAWHVVMLNTSAPMAAGSAQEQWLRGDLAAHPGRCTLAVLHHPRFSSGVHGDNAPVAPLWRALYDAGADLVLSGHDHVYERFLRLTPDGRPDPGRGIRSFVVGTGGARHTPFRRRARGSEARLDGTWGVLKLTLRADRYEWAFVTAASGRALDHGEDPCR
ncbi:MAG TPA: metallophosphoesterase [Longimicrobium sp.]|nr:metallophosphoesterase [Longimicrobium sp.]